MRIAHPSRAAAVLAAHSLLPPPCRCVAPTRLPARNSPVRRGAKAPLLHLRPRAMASLSPLVAAPSSAEEDPKFGFRRAEMYKSSLSNTVDAYDRHVFVCFKGPEAWAPKVEESEAAELPKLLSSAVKARKNDIAVKTKLTICGGFDGFECSNGDVLIFPDMIKYKGLSESDVDSFVDNVLVDGRPWASGTSEVITGSYVFVCAHGSRDLRCGVCGPALIEKLNEEIKLRGLKDQVFVSPCSHIGGHKYAGNLIIYNRDQEGNVTGHWYGYVTPNDVPDVLDQHITKGSVIERLLRGQMGTSSQTDEKESGESEKPQASITGTLGESSFACCQEANGVSCGSNTKS